MLKSNRSKSRSLVNLLPLRIRSRNVPTGRHCRAIGHIRKRRPTTSTFSSTFNRDGALYGRRAVLSPVG